jgi:hypothetical protein
MAFRRSEPARGSARRLDALLLGGVASALVVGAIACTTLRPVKVEPVPAEASALFDEAEALDALDATGERAAPARERAAELARRALEVAPDWIAPQRLIDDLMRAELRGVDALEAHRDRLAHAGDDARELYLAGRLEGVDGEPRFARAADLDPTLAWARHGLAVSSERRGDLRAAVLHARAAALRARDAWERSFFASSLARFLSHSGRREDALDVIAARLAEPDVSVRDRRSLQAQAAEAGLDDRDPHASLAAYRRGLECLADPELPDGEVETLAARLRSAVGHEEGGLLDISNALAAKRSPARDRLRAELLLDSGPTPLALGLLERSFADEGRSEPSGPLIRAARFAAGEFAPAVERWLADLPSRVRGEDGLPRDERLAEVVRRARALGRGAPGDGAVEPWFEFGDALVAAGWFREGRALAGLLARADFERALALDGRASAGVQLLDSLDDLIRGADSRAGRRLAAARADRDESGGVEPRRESARASVEEPHDLTELLSAMGPLFARAAARLGGDLDAGRTSRDLAGSPRLDYGVAGEVVHPGPAFTAEDERAGLGKEGRRVPGLAEKMESIHRFALLGELSGAGGPDGTVLPRVMTEESSGEHLGVPWSGSVAWCEGADVRSRAERRGARISAAALHEGYWLDIDAVRGELSQFTALRATFSGPDTAARVERALSVQGFPVDASGDEDVRRRDRTRTGAALGEAGRVRLALLYDRRHETPDKELELGEMTLDELALDTGIHEEGHLTDRTRFLPLSKHWRSALLFLVQCGFSPTKVAERLEYRAELVALADAPDPRVPLAQVLDAAESGGRGPTAHAAGYEELLENFLDVLDEELGANPGRYPEIDAGRTLVHQLHRLPPASVRDLARALAGKKGLIRG